MGTNWRHKDIWTKRHATFSVEVTRHEASPTEDRGIHRWCVYAYLYPKHPLFPEFTSDKMFQPATDKIPLHAYCSFCARHQQENEVTSVQVGADYDHLHDKAYTHMATKEQARAVFADAEQLITWLSNYQAPASPPALFTHDAGEIDAAVSDGRCGASEQERAQWAKENLS